MKFAQRLKELRIARGLSQQKLAEAISVSQSAVTKWEVGRTEPTASALVALSKFFGESIEYILGLDD